MHQPLPVANGAHARLGHDPSRPILWEAAHYYVAKGPTIWSQTGWSVMSSLAHESDSRMLFLDDVHPTTNVHPHERSLERIVFEPQPEPTHIALESKMLACAHEVLEVLKRLPRRQRARKIGGVWHCSGFPLQGRDGRPLCLFFDLGLTWHKRKLGFKRAVNVVPEFYAEEQRRLVRLVSKAMPDFEFSVILHDIHGDWRHLE
jgi:hypothetical protein